MANAGFLIEAMWSLCAFYVLGIVVLSFVDADRGAAARDKTLHLRRWVRNKTVRNIDNRNAATELASNERVQNVETEIPTNIELNTRCDESESVL